MWPSAMTTLALMAVSIILSTIVGIPLGIASAVWPTVNKILRPMLDLMQILPAFAYLVPIVVLLSIGNPAGIVATFIYAVPPLVRFTEIGIRSVRKDVIEAAEAFGATRRQILRDVQLPLAAQAIMLGLNQVIMMALSIVVIASLIGAGGLGDPVLNALQTQQIGEGVVAGILIVFMAMWLDRTSAAFGRRTDRSRATSSRTRLTRNQLLGIWGVALAVVLDLPVRVQPGRLAVELGLLGCVRCDASAQLDHERVHRHRDADQQLPDARRPQPVAAVPERRAVVADGRARRDDRLGARRVAARHPAVGLRCAARLDAGARRLHVPGHDLVQLRGLERRDGDSQPRARRPCARPDPRDSARDRRIPVADRRSDPASDPRLPPDPPGLRLPDPGRGAVRRGQRRGRERVLDLRASRSGQGNDIGPPRCATRRDRGGSGVRVDEVADPVRRSSCPLLVPI